MNTFYDDVKNGLSGNPKKLNSKYFYDTIGDSIFQKLMHSPEYYLSNCELEILKDQSSEIATNLLKHFKEFDLIELGAGDASKSTFLLKALLQHHAEFTYYPIDISSNVINNLEYNLPRDLPSLNMKGLNGEYLTMLKQQTEQSKKPKVILFLGSNIGNMQLSDAIEFCRNIHQLLKENDLLFIGFDLKKDPKRILAAYNDKEGLTRDFNLNLLKRINKELKGTFDSEAFYHYPCYDPGTGECKSYLISKKDQEVTLGHDDEEIQIHFDKHEAIYMEISRKFDLSEIKKLADSTNFKLTNHFFDSKKWFVNSLWKKG